MVAGRRAERAQREARPGEAQPVLLPDLGCFVFGAEDRYESHTHLCGTARVGDSGDAQPRTAAGLAARRHATLRRTALAAAFDGLLSPPSARFGRLSRCAAPLLRSTAQGDGTGRMPSRLQGELRLGGL